jgi:FAD/FMN-containing dehydrogenase
MRRYESWGRVRKPPHTVLRWNWRDADLPTELGKSMLAFGNGRSYGDCCLNDEGVLIDAQGLDRFIAFNAETGVLRCEAGVLLADILELAVPQGWFLPVTPGTQFVTLGGAVANDVHGKNHHRAGTLGRHVRCLELLRSDGTRLHCSSTENRDWFCATIGGLGLTGLITWIEIQLKPVPGPDIDQETIRFEKLDQFFQLSDESDKDFEYTVAWIDATAKGPALGRGLFIRGNHATHRRQAARKRPGRPLRVPFDPPFSLLNGPALRLFNSLYYRKQLQKRTRTTVGYAPFFYPLDAIDGWNRLYGRRGLLQYQCVIPSSRAETALAEILGEVASSGVGSMLAVLKMFGDLPSPGLLSFPRPGATLAIDFPNSGERILDLLDRLDVITMQAGGGLYPAKDARMSASTFRQSFPHWKQLERFIDPQFSSSFWRRCGKTE